MVTAELGDRTLELESEFVVDIDDLRVFRYSDLCRCSKDGFSRCLTLWGLDGIEKEFGLISGYSYKRDRDVVHGMMPSSLLETKFLRFILAFALHLGYELFQLDIDTAYLYGN